MKIKHVLFGLISSSTLLTSCVGEDVVFRENESSVNFERKLHSIAEDEMHSLSLIFRDSVSNIINDISDINIDYSSDQIDILTVNEQGTVTPISKGEDTLRTFIRVNAFNSNFIFDEIEDDIIVGKVTITESEALLIDQEELAKIVNQGYTPKITITNPISQIGIENETEIQLIANFQNLKNKPEDVDFIWKSDDSTILDITENGILIPVSKGNTNITVTTNDSDGNAIATESLLVEVSERTVIIEPVIEPEPIDTKEIIGFGDFRSGTGTYTSSGDFQITIEDGVTKLELNENFEFHDENESIPDLVIYLSNRIDTNSGAALISDDIDFFGAQSFIIPESVDPGNYLNVLLYCRRFGVFVGYAPINR